MPSFLSMSVLLQPDLALCQKDFHLLVIAVGYVDELNGAPLHAGDGGNDVRGSEGYVLHAGAVVEVDVLFDLGFLLAVRRLVDGHFDQLVQGGHDDGFERRVLGEDILVVDGPGAVEAEGLFIADSSSICVFR